MEYRPQVLLLGNGVTFNERNGNWNKVITSLSEKEIVSHFDNLPYALKSSMTLSVNDKKRREKYKEFFSEKYYYLPNGIIKKLLDINFDAILTTNYTYEIENESKESYLNLSDKQKKNIVCWTTDKSDKNIFYTGLIE